jgi:hypothetical protein
MQLLLDRLAAMALLDGCCAHHLDELLLDGQDKGRVKERAQVCSRTCIVPEKQKRAAEPRGRKDRYCNTGKNCVHIEDFQNVLCSVGVRMQANMHLQQQQICRQTATCRPFLPAKSSVQHRSNRITSCRAVSHPNCA